MNAPEKPSAPAYLAPLTRAWWEAVVSRWQLEDHHIRLLTLAAAVSNCNQVLGRFPPRTAPRR